MTTNLSPDYELLMLRDMVQDLTKEIEHERNRANQMTKALMVQRQIHGEELFNTSALNVFRSTLTSLLHISRMPKISRTIIEDTLEWEALNR
jgi:hypothetical protein